MLAMPRPRPPYLLREKSRHSVTCWYVRKGDGPRTRIRGAYGSDAFMAEYHAAVAGAPPKKVGKRDVGEGSLTQFLAQYRESNDWAKLSPVTRKTRGNIFLDFEKKSGDLPYDAIDKDVIAEGLTARRAKPAMANAFLKAVRGLFKWAVGAGKVTDNPTLTASAPTPRTDGWHSWTDEEVARYEARWPIGTRQRLAFDVLLYTGLRRGDALLLGRQHVKNGVFRIKAEKNGVEIIAPILAPLARSIAASPTGDLAFIVSERGRPMTKNGFSNWFSRACDAASVPGSAHGLRKAGAARAAENGATNEQLKAIFGWTDDAMPSLYTRKASRSKLAAAAMEKLILGGA